MYLALILCARARAPPSQVLLNSPAFYPSFLPYLLPAPLSFSFILLGLVFHRGSLASRDTTRRPRPPTRLQLKRRLAAKSFLQFPQPRPEQSKRQSLTQPLGKMDFFLSAGFNDVRCSGLHLTNQRWWENIPRLIFRIQSFLSRKLQLINEHLARSFSTCRTVNLSDPCISDRILQRKVINFCSYLNKHFD